MNSGIFGIQYSFGLQQSAVKPLFTLIGADADLPILNPGRAGDRPVDPAPYRRDERPDLAPPVGRRRPFFLIGAIGCSVILFLFPFVSALWMAVLALWLLDAANNTATEPYRAFISDMLPKSQLARGFLTQSMFVGFGAVAANLSIFVFQQLIDGQFGALPLWVYSAFWLGAVCSIGSVLISVLSTKEFPPTEEELAELRAKPRGLVASVREIADAVRVMPKGMHKIGLVFPFQWYAMFVYWQFVTVSMGATVWNAGPDDPAYEQAAGWTGLVNGAYNLVTMFAAFGLMGMAARFGAKKVHAGALLIAAVFAGLVLPDHQPVSAVHPHDRSGHRLGLDDGRALHPGVLDGAQGAHRRVHGHRQHDDRGPDADRDPDLRLDLPEPAR